MTRRDGAATVPPVEEPFRWTREGMLLNDAARP